MNPWRPIETYEGHDYEKVDLWMDVWASPLSMGMADKFRVPEAWRQSGKWLDKNGELTQRYITHWMPMPPEPPPTKDDVERAQEVIKRSLEETP